MSAVINHSSVYVFHLSKHTQLRHFTDYLYPLCSAVPPQALVGLLKHDVIPMSSENLATLSERCRDPAVSVKKKALQCVGEMLAVSLNQQLRDSDRTWTNIFIFLKTDNSVE